MHRHSRSTVKSSKVGRYSGTADPPKGYISFFYRTIVHGARNAKAVVLASELVWFLLLQQEDAMLQDLHKDGIYAIGSPTSG